MKYYIVGRPIGRRLVCGVAINSIEWLLDGENEAEVFTLDEALDALHMPSLEWAERAGYILEELCP